MRDQGTEGPWFHVGHCPHCERNVLTHLTYRDDGTEQHVCVTCDAMVDSDLHLVDASDLEERGYVLLDPPDCCGQGKCRRS